MSEATQSHEVHALTEQERILAKIDRLKLRTEARAQEAIGLRNKAIKIMGALVASGAAGGAVFKLLEASQSAPVITNHPTAIKWGFSLITGLLAVRSLIPIGKKLDDVIVSELNANDRAHGLDATLSRLQAASQDEDESEA